MTITLTPIDINAQIQGQFPINITLDGLIQINPVIGGVGVKGDKGDSGNSVTYTAGEDIGGHIAVFMSNELKVCPASPKYHLPILGITVAAAENGANVEVKSSGVISMNGWNFALNSPVFVLDNGTLSTTEDPLAVWSTVVGISNSPTSLVVNIQPQIKLN